MRGFIGWTLVRVLLAGLTATGCGGGLENAHAEVAPHEDDSMRARQWHEQVVRLEGEATVAARGGEECAERCAIASRTCELSGQICELAERDDHDEGTRVLCEDSRPRCDATRSAAGECGCAASGPQ